MRSLQLLSEIISKRVTSFICSVSSPVFHGLKMPFHCSFEGLVLLLGPTNQAVTPDSTTRCNPGNFKAIVRERGRPKGKDRGACKEFRFWQIILPVCIKRNIETFDATTLKTLHIPLLFLLL